MTVKRFRKKPVVIEAVLVKPSLTVEELWAWEKPGGKSVFQPGRSGEFIIQTLEGAMKASVGDWIIRGIAGEFYPCKPDIFAKTYIKEP